MRLIAALACAVLLVACSSESSGPESPTGSEELSEGDRSFALSHLHASRKLFLDSVTKLSKEQWSYKPAEDRWSIAEVSEHIMKTEAGIYEMVTGELLNTEATEPRNDRESDIKLIARLHDRSSPAQAGPEVRPTGDVQGGVDVETDFRSLRDRSLAFMRETKRPLRNYLSDDGTLAIDAYQYFLVVASHTERHVEQINEVKAAPDYPAK